MHTHGSKHSFTITFDNDEDKKINFDIVYRGEAHLLIEKLQEWLDNPENGTHQEIDGQ